MIFIAWSVMFMHNVIPHNHLSEGCQDCHELIHNTNPTENDCNGALKYKPEPPDVRICHIANILYHQFTDDTLIHQAFSSDEHSLPVLNISVFTDPEKSFVRDNHCGTLSFRAPPAL